MVKNSSQISMQNVPDEISFKVQGEWLENAGIVGLMRILDDSDYRIFDNCLFVKSDVFRDGSFVDKYFNYFIRAYGFQTRVYKIIEYKRTLHYWLSLKPSELDSKKVYDSLYYWYIYSLKYYTNSNVAKRIFKLKPTSFDVLKVVNGFKSDMDLLKKSQDDLQIFGSVLFSLIPKLQKVIDYFSIPDVSRMCMAKTLSYIIIKNAWSDISFLNANSKEPNLYQDYNKVFVAPIDKYLTSSHRKDDYECFTCGRPMGVKGHSYSFLTDMGYDVNKKNSNGWNFGNDQMMCPICFLMYSAVPAGFNYNMHNQGVFINQSTSLESLYNANSKIGLELHRAAKTGQTMSAWQAFSLAFQNSVNDASAYTLDDIQVIHYDSDHYRFAFISKAMANVLNDAVKNKIKLPNGGVKSLLSRLFKTGIKQFNGSNCFSIYDSVLEHLLDSSNLNSLIDMVMQLKIVKYKDLYLSNYQVFNLLQINLLYFKEITDMEITEDDLRHMRGCGQAIRDGYDNKTKASSLAYRLLQALKIQNTDDFMNSLLTAYLYQHKLVPKFFIQKINSPEEFTQLGYAFVSGLVPNDQKNVKN
jgi:CRISPR-associated protein Cst1